MLLIKKQPYRFFNISIIAALVFVLILSSGLSAQTGEITKGDYTVFKEHNISYTGFIGNTLGFEIGKRKVCAFCETKHRKFFGLGLELGFDKFKQFVIGPKFRYERGTDGFGLGITLVPYLTAFKEFGYWVRPEILFFPTKDHSFSIGAGINFHNNINRRGSGSDSFGIPGLSLRHYFIN